MRIDAATDEVLAAAKTIGKRHGLDKGWFDLKAAQFVPRGDDVRAKRSRTVTCSVSLSSGCFSAITS